MIAQLHICLIKRGTPIPKQGGITDPMFIKKFQMSRSKYNSNDIENATRIYTEYKRIFQ
jgi:hypothetical protein